jgi:hypothetical protein
MKGFIMESNEYVLFSIYDIDILLVIMLSHIYEQLTLYEELYVPLIETPSVRPR